MIAGYYYTLKVNRISEHGVYLIDADGTEVLLPNRYVSLDHTPGTEVEVFVYFDSEDRLIATTEHPAATVGEVAVLKVVDTTVHGAFMDWGITAKDLFVPNRNQAVTMEVGRSYPVYLYTDNITGRIVGTARLKSHINNTILSVNPHQKVQIVVTSELPVGFRVVVNSRNWGVVYTNQIFRPLSVGDQTEGYVARITEDNRIDITLQQQGLDEVREGADRLVDLMQLNGGSLPLCDNSAPEEVQRLARMSKKSFKRSVGYLLKRGHIAMDDRSIRLVKGE